MKKIKKEKAPKAKKVQINKSQTAQLNKVAKASVRASVIGIVLLVIYSAMSLWLTFVNAEEIESVKFLNQYRLGSKNLTFQVQSYAVTGNPTFYDGYMKELNEDKNRDIALEGLRKNDISDEEWATLDHIAELSNGLVPLEEGAMAEVAKGSTSKATGLVFGTQYVDTIVEITELTDQCIDDISNRLDQKKNTINVIMILSELIFIVAFVYMIRNTVKVISFSKNELLTPIIKVSKQIELLSQGNFQGENDMEIDESEVGQMVGAIAFMKKNFSDMIMEISNVLDEMSNGNYRIEITQEYVGEFIAIKDSLYKIVEETKGMLDTIRRTAKEIDGGSEQLAKASMDLAEGSTIQATKVSDVANAINDMASRMEKMSQNAQETVDLSSRAGETVMESNEKMHELQTAIGEISKCSEEIRTIIEAIQEIADQTNLLSLNAAIEAARAGEAGKGFAVVAEQVKNLAEESAKAAGETTKLIEMTVAAVDKGIMIAKDTAENMNEVMIGAKTATEKMQVMAEDLRKEANDMKIIDSDINEVAQIVDNNSATSEETAAVSQEQTAQVETMVQMMEKFQI